MPESRCPTLDCHCTLHRGEFDLQAAITIQTPQYVGIFGPSGSGKSSFLRILAGLEKPAEGFLRVNGQPWFEPGRFVPPQQRRMACVFQDARLFPHLSVRDNLLYGRRQRRLPENTRQWQQLIDVLKLGPLLPLRPAHLSGGQQQRVAIGRALLSEPELLLLDEPLSGLDARARTEILAYLEEIHRARRLTTVHVSHDWHEIARLCDHVTVLADGQVVQNDKVAAVAQQLALSGSQLPEHAPVNVLDLPVVGWDQRRQLMQLQDDTLSLSMPSADKPPAAGTTVRVVLAATDIALARQAPAETSFLNAIACQIDAIHPARQGTHLVSLKKGHWRLLAAVSHASVEAMGLAPGQTVHALVKGTRAGHFR
jgi:molybdate transport system ATP-binding protein